MAKFEESKHPRDEDGKFTNGNGHAKTNSKDVVRQDAEKRKELEKKYVSDLPIVPNKAQLTKQEWKLWYNAVAEYKKLGYWVNKTNKGRAILKVEVNTGHKIVITGGTFEKPKAIAIYSFKSSDTMNDFIERFKKKW